MLSSVQQQTSSPKLGNSNHNNFGNKNSTKNSSKKNKIVKSNSVSVNTNLHQENFEIENEKNGRDKSFSMLHGIAKILHSRLGIIRQHHSYYFFFIFLSLYF